MANTIKYAEKVAVYVSRGAWTAFDRLKRIRSNASFSSKWGGGFILNNWQEKKPVLGLANLRKDTFASLQSEVKMRNILTLLVTALALSVPLIAQQSFTSQWEQRASQTQARQPAWPSPLITTSVGLVQLARADYIHQTASNLTTTWNLDGGKGLDLIPGANTEVDINLPPYLVHSAPTVANGAGDMSFVLKYRFLSAGAERGNYVMSAFLSSTIPTGSYKNGSRDATVSPNVGVGKGFGLFAVQSTLGASLPVADTFTLGRTILWNTALQAHIARYFWPEVEYNSTFYKGGVNDGNSQAFVTPGVLVARKIRPREASSRLAICTGAGEQIATSSFHSYNHEIAVTTRLMF